MILSAPAAGVRRHDPQRRGLRGHLHAVHQGGDHQQAAGSRHLCRNLDAPSLEAAGAVPLLPGHFFFFLNNEQNAEEGGWSSLVN